MQATPTNPRNTYTQDDREHNDALKEQYTRMIAYNARHFRQGD